MPYNQNKTNYRTLFAEVKQISTDYVPDSSLEEDFKESPIYTGFWKFGKLQLRRFREIRLFVTDSRNNHA